jgi:PAS domain S-box-containing protein
MTVHSADDKVSHILYVDDEPGLLELGKIFLEMNPKVNVDTATGPHEALKLMEEKRYSVVVSDYQMPDMDGIQFLKKLRAEGEDVPFIIFTGKGREEVVIEALNNGADFYLQKGGDARSQFAELWNMVRHVIDRRDSENELNASRCLMDATIDSIPDIVGILNTDCEVLCYNKAGYDYLKKSPEEVVGRKCHIVENRNRHCQECEFEEAKEKGDLVEFVRYNAENDTYLDFRINPIFNERRELEYMVEIIRDVSQSRKEEEQLRKSEETYRSLVTNSSQGIAVTSGQRLLFINPSAVQVLGYREDEILAMSCHDLVHPDDMEAVIYRQGLREQGEEDCRPHLLRLLSKSGSTIWVESNARRMDWKGERASLFFFTDATERMRTARIWEQVIGLMEKLLEEADSQNMLDSLATISQRNDPDIRSTVLLYDEEGNKLVLGAAPDMPAEYHRLMRAGMPVSENTGSCGLAAHRKRSVIVKDILNGPCCAGMGEFLDMAERHGLRSCHAQPILTPDGRLLGTITNYCCRPGIPDAEEVYLLEQTANMAALVISQCLTG